MQTKSYYRKSKYTECNEERFDIPLCLNCCGVWATDLFFKSDCLGRNDFYMIFQYKGSISGTAGGNAFTLGSGQIIIIPPHTAYIYENIPGERTEYLWLHFSGSNAQKLVSELGFEFCVSYTIGTDKHIIACYEELFDEFIRYDKHLDQIAVACLIKICVMLSRSMSNPEKRSAKRKKLELSVKYIDEHYFQKIDISYLARLEHLSSSRYRVVFKECFGMSAQEYITSLRLTNASTLLTKTNLSIKEIADSTGFSDQLYFSRIFAKKYKVSPTVYRNTYK